ncbi:hypothetical protein VULLAG_LOCUS10576 [Vulpes lagopus]
MRRAVSRRAPRGLPAQGPGGGTRNAWAAVGGVYPGGGTGDAGRRALLSSAGLPASAEGARRQRPGEGGAARCWEAPRVGRLRSPSPRAAASQLRAGEAAGVGAPGSGQVRRPARRVLPSDPGMRVQMPTQLPQGIPLGD